MGEVAGITLERLHKQFGEFIAVNDLDLDIRPGEFVSLLGPSGCGKTTTLRMLAGLEFPTRGTIRFGERVVNDLAPAKRNIAMVFQSYALYPHMTVAENIAYPLKKRGVPKALRPARVAAVARLLQLETLLTRKPRQLSGGQQQRVALGRALVREPDIFLLDEPLSNLDAKLRAHMRTELIELHRKIGKTMVYVTHDQLEAMTMSSRIAVMRDGFLQQFGTPAEIYDRPANVFVADFIGTPSMTLLDAELHFVGAAAEARIGPLVVPLPAGHVAAERARQDRDQARREAGGYHSRRAGLSRRGQSRRTDGTREHRALRTWRYGGHRTHTGTCPALRPRASPGSAFALQDSTPSTAPPVPAW